MVPGTRASGSTQRDDGASGGAVTRVAVIGAYGRMGLTACRAVEGAPALELVARVGSADDLAAALRDAAPDVALDLTRPAAVVDDVDACLRAGVSVVVGTSGVAGERLDRVRALVEAAPSGG